MKKFGFLLVFVAVMAMGTCAWAGLGEEGVTFKYFVSSFGEHGYGEPSYSRDVRFGEHVVANEYISVFLIGELVRFEVVKPAGAVWSADMLSFDADEFAFDTVFGGIGEQNKNYTHGWMAPGVQPGDTIKTFTLAVKSSSDTYASLDITIPSERIWRAYVNPQYAIQYPQTMAFLSGDSKISSATKTLQITWPERGNPEAGIPSVRIYFPTKFTKVSFTDDSPFSKDFNISLSSGDNSIFTLTTSGDPFPVLKTGETNSSDERTAKFNISFDYQGHDSIWRSGDIDGTSLDITLTTVVTPPSPDPDPDPDPVPISSVTLPQYTTLLTGGTATLTASISPGDATSPTYTWTTSNAAVATVSGSGSSATVTGVSVGSATVTVSVTAGGATKTASSAVTVNAGPVISVTLDKSSMTLTTGGGAKTATLHATTDPKDVASPVYAWTISNSLVATVTETGNGKSAIVNAVAAGNATVTVSVTAGGATRTATCEVKVEADVRDKPADPIKPNKPDGTSEGVNSEEAKTKEKVSDVVNALEMNGMTASDFIETGGKVTPTKDTMAQAAGGVSVNEVTPLPVFEAPAETGKVTMVAFTYSGKDLMVESKKAADVKVLKKLGASESAYFKYESNPAKFADECFTILASGTNTVVTVLGDESQYDLALFIAKGGRFDLSKSPTTVADPAAIIASTAEPENPKSSGGGCALAFAPFALLLAIPLFFRKKK